MKKKQSNCEQCVVIKRCVFKVRSTSKQEMLQSRTLLSEQTHKIMLNNGLGQTWPLNVRNYSGMLNATKPSFSPKVYENITVH